MLQKKLHEKLLALLKNPFGLGIKIEPYWINLEYENESVGQIW